MSTVEKAEKDLAKIKKAQKKADKAQVKADKLQRKATKTQRKTIQKNSLENFMVIVAMVGMVALAVAATVVSLNVEPGAEGTADGAEA